MRSFEGLINATYTREVGSAAKIRKLLGARGDDRAVPGAVSLDMRPRTAEQRLLAVERAIAAMKERYQEPLSLQAIAEAAIFSPYHFNRFFSEITGLSPVRFLAAIRLHQAKRRLLETNHSVARVCYEVGWNSLGTFTRQFTTQVGVQPSRFRNAAPEAVAFCRRLLERDPVPRSFPAGSSEGVEVVPVGCAAPGETVFLGLFPRGVPRGAPQACAIAGPGATVRLALPNKQRGVVMALALGSDLTMDALVADDAPRGSLDLEAVDADRGPVSIRLRPRQETDPPILLALPFLIHARFGRNRTAPSK